MAQFPRTEADVKVLVQNMIAGYTAHVADFPSADNIGLTAAQAAYITAKTGQTDALAAAQVATEAKETQLEALEEFMRTELKKSELDVNSDPEKLGYIGWGPKAPPTASTAPGQPRNLEAVAQNPDSVFLDWKPAVRGSGGAVRTYIVDRREQPAGGGEFGDWTQIAIALQSESNLTSQPRGLQLEYRVKGVNIGGESMPSNTVAVVL